MNANWQGAAGLGGDGTDDDELVGEDLTEEQVREAEVIEEALRRILFPEGPLPEGTLERISAAAMDAYERGVRDVPWTPVMLAAALAVVAVSLGLGLGGAVHGAVVPIALAVAAVKGLVLRAVLEYDDPP